MPQEKFELVFKLEKETPGTFRFKEQAPKDKIVVGALYVKKTALAGTPPQGLVVTIKPETQP